jgi:phospho-N-acetylmuramoyl-pentapeptide-transferase
MDYVLILISLITSFFIAMAISPVFLKLSKKKEASQTILHYVQQHSEKKGTPTMGGVVFILSTLVATLAFGGFRGTMALVILLIFCGYGVIGFLDDFIKVKLKRNLGLRAYQKIITQVAIAVIAAFYAYNSQFIGSSILISGFNVTWNLGWAFIPFAALIFIAMTNAVNLTDGLDGLAGSTSAIYFATFLVIILLGVADATVAGNALHANELQNLGVFVAALIGSLIAFLWFNGYKAKMMMGDTGALALGGAAAAVALFVRNPLISALIGVMFVVSSLSVIIQVVSFKLRKKRVFLMAPFHHHLELKGVNESKIVTYYCIVTAIAAITAIILISI